MNDSGLALLESELRLGGAVTGATRGAGFAVGRVAVAKETGMF